MIALSANHVEPVFRAREINQPIAEISPDLGLTRVQVKLTESGIILPGEANVSWQELEHVRKAAQNCFEYTPEGLKKIQAYSEFTNRHYGLMATNGAPTMLVSGIPMHRIKDTDPHQDTLAKIRAIQPVLGHVLDTATGLGYTAIQAAHTAEHVITVELDPTVMEIIRRNPWSQPLLNHPRIEQRFGDSFEEIQEFNPETFQRIIHDPPTMSLAGELYSREFYRELYRVLSPRGLVFHYIGDLDSKLGSRVARGAIQRLKEAGFSKVIMRREAFGLVARK